MIKIIIAGLIIGLAVFCSSCKDKNCPDYLQYQIPYTATLPQDTFQIGDTIWMEMNFADQLTDVRGNIQNTFKNFDFRLELQCDKMDIDPPQAKAVSYMDAIAIAGEIVPQGISYYDIIPLYQGNRYIFKIAVVLKEQGMFVCAINPFSSNANPFELNGNCNHSPLNISSKVNGGDPIANNYHLLKNSPVEVYRNMTLEEFGQNSFCFVVK